MTIYKSGQRDPRSFFDYLVFGLLLKEPCPSYLTEYKGKRRVCIYRRGHKNMHTDGEIKWGYGDNWLK